MSGDDRQAIPKQADCSEVCPSNTPVDLRELPPAAIRAAKWHNPHIESEVQAAKEACSRRKRCKTRPTRGRISATTTHPKRCDAWSQPENAPPLKSLAAMPSPANPLQ